MRISDWSSDVCSSDLPAASTKLFSTASPSITSADLPKPSLARSAVSALVLPSLTAIESRTISEPALAWLLSAILRPSARTFKSEEHTSELQSLMRISYAVFCLQKKKKTQTKNIIQKDLNINNKQT